MINLPNSQLVSLQLNISNLAIATISISELYSVLVSMVPTSLVDSPRLVSFMHKLPVTTSNAILTRGIALRFTVFGSGGTVGREVGSDSKHPWFNSSRRQFLNST